MGNQGRFGKYGEMKRLERLRQSGTRTTLGKSQTGTGRPWSSPPKDAAGQKEAIGIREAKWRDKGFIVRLSGKVFDRYGPYEEMVGGWLRSEGTATLVAVMKGKPVGFAMIGYLLDDQGSGIICELLAIAVEPEKQRMGIGRRLMEETERRIAKRGENRLLLHTALENIGAQELFLASGFERGRVRKRFYPAGQDALEMCKEIRIPEGPCAAGSGDLSA